MTTVSFPRVQQQPWLLRACLPGRDWFEEHMAFVIQTTTQIQSLWIQGAHRRSVAWGSGPPEAGDTLLSDLQPNFQGQTIGHFKERGPCDFLTA